MEPLLRLWSRGIPPDGMVVLPDRLPSVCVRGIRGQLTDTRRLTPTLQWMGLPFRLFAFFRGVAFDHIARWTVASGLFCFQNRSPLLRRRKCSSLPTLWKWYGSWNLVFCFGVFGRFFSLCFISAYMIPLLASVLEITVCKCSAMIFLFFYRFPREIC